VRERKHRPQRPLLAFLESLAHKLPQKWDTKRNDYVRNDDWLLWDLQRDDGGAEVWGPRASTTRVRPSSKRPGKKRENRQGRT
jgi:hypothetical protein